MLLAPEVKQCLTIHKLCIIEEHKTFKGYNDSKRLLDRSQKYKIIESKKISAMLAKIWRKSFNSGVVIPAKKRLCNECYDKIGCDRCFNQVSENKEIETNLNLIKRQAPNQFGHMIPYSKYLHDICVIYILCILSQF